MFISRVIQSRNLKYIYNDLKYINLVNFKDLREQCYHYINFDKTFNIQEMMINENYNVKLIQLFDDTRVNICYDSVYMCINGSHISQFNNKEIKCTAGDVSFVKDKGTFHTIYNPGKFDTVCILFEKNKFDFYYFT